MARSQFFTESHVTDAFKNSISVLNLYIPERQIIKDLTKALLSSFKIILNNPAIFDENCPQNIEWIGSSYLSALSGLKNLPQNSTEEAIDKFEEELEYIYTLTFRFIKELQYSLPGEVSIELYSFLSYGDKNFRHFSEENKQNISYANYIMPAQIIKQMLHSAEIKSFMDFQKKTENAAEMKKRWDAEITQKTTIFEEFSEKIKRLTSEYNFVGLQHGFKSIYDEKKSDLKTSRNILIALGAIAITPLIFQLSIFYFDHEFFVQRLTELKYIAPVFLAIEILLLYFFRIALQNLNSIRLQLLQLNLRMTLCQFIQSYADYSGDIKNKNNSSLEKFESIIFSQIAPDESSLPSTFDGIEQLAKLIQSARGR